MHCVSRGGCYLVNSFCDLQEENLWRKESYQACWLSVVLETRPQYKLTLSETDSTRRESYKQQQVINFLVERTPGQALRMGRDGGVMTEHQLPLFSTSGDHDEDTEPVVSLGKGHGGAEEQEVTTMSHDLSKPVRVNFRAASLMASPRERSHRVQKRE